MTDFLRRALAAAQERGMSLQQDEHRPHLCRIICQTCGWGRTFPADTRIDRYARGPFSCHACALEAGL